MAGRRDFLKRLLGGMVASVAVVSAGLAPAAKVMATSPSKRKHRPTKKENQAAIFAAFAGTTYQPGVMKCQHEPLYDSLTTAEYRERAA